MATPRSRRGFLSDVGRGMLVAGVGVTAAVDLGLARANAGDDSATLDFGKLEPLVDFMQDTSPDRIVAECIAKLKAGTDLKTLVAAAALANARSFGGEDYIGFHTMMAMAPAFHISAEMPAGMAALPVLKVIRRNTGRIQEAGTRNTLRPIARSEATPDHSGEALRAAVRAKDLDRAEKTFATFQGGSPDDAFNAVLVAVQDNTEVHRVVLPFRAWDLLALIGPEHANTLLRQSVHYCARTENQMIERKYPKSPIRTVLPALLDQYKLLGKGVGQKSGDDAWLAGLAKSVFRGSREQAADAVAQAIAEGYSPESIGEAISLAANMLVLHDPGRPEKSSNADKPAGSCHGDSVGVHASDSANAWRNIVRVSDARNTIAGLIVGAFHTGGQSERSTEQPYPHAEHLTGVKTDDPKTLLGEADEAIRAKDQLRTAALISRYGQLGGQPKPVFDLLLKFATSEDGALHAEKYFHTVSSEFLATRSAFRWGQLVALARVTASEYGHKSAGYEEAKKLLNV